MPTIYREGGFRFVIWLNDHPPPHVHVIKAGNEMIVELGLNGSLPDIAENRGMNNREMRAALLIVAVNNQAFLDQWQEIHGETIDN